MTQPIESRRPKVGVAVLILRAGRLLLIQRKGAHGAGTWATPGGHLEYGEDPTDCARREAREEVGVEVDQVTFRGVTNDVFEAEGKHYITLWMSAQICSGEPGAAAKDEVAQWGWFDPANLPQPLFLPLRNLLQGQCLGERQHEEEMECRVGCGACCIALSISSPIPGMPRGKAAGVRCLQLSEDNRCLIYGQPDRPEVCIRLRPNREMCGDSMEHALAYLTRLEEQTRPR